MAQALTDTFYVIDLGLLTRLHAHFVAAMPRVTPFYAVKCMPDRAMMSTLAALGDASHLLLETFTDAPFGLSHARHNRLFSS